jgi:hypothetical protein
MKDRQRMKPGRTARFAEISVVPDEEEHELVVGPPDEGARGGARARCVRRVRAHGGPVA